MKSFILGVGACSALANQFAINPECNANAGSAACDSACTADQTDCIIACNQDATCISGCSRDFVECQNSKCPCYGECYDGCPCSYETSYCTDYPESGEDIEVLVFQPSKKDASNPQQVRFSWPVVSKGGELGKHAVRDAVIKIPASMNEERRGMCHFTLNGEMYIVGGGNTDHPSNIPFRKRNYRVDKTEVVQLPDIPFEMQSGRCINYDGESVMFTAAWNKGYDTYIWKGVQGEYEQVGRPTYDHYVGDVVVFNDENGESGVMIIAGEFEYYGTTEFYNPRTKSWTYKNRVKEHEWLYGFTTININGVAYMFGGKEFSKEFRRDIWMMAEPFKWEMHPQKLVEDRLYHRTIQTGRHVLHFGGYGDDKQEAWELQADGNFEMTTANYVTKEWKYYPYIFNVGPNDF